MLLVVPEPVAEPGNAADADDAPEQAAVAGDTATVEARADRSTDDHAHDGATEGGPAAPRRSWRALLTAPTTTRDAASKRAAPASSPRP